MNSRAITLAIFTRNGMDAAASTHTSTQTSTQKGTAIFTAAPAASATLPGNDCSSGTRVRYNSRGNLRLSSGCAFSSATTRRRASLTSATRALPTSGPARDTSCRSLGLQNAVNFGALRSRKMTERRHTRRAFDDTSRIAASPIRDASRASADGLRPPIESSLWRAMARSVLFFQ